MRRRAVVRLGIGLALAAACAALAVFAHARGAHAPPGARSALVLVLTLAVGAGGVLFVAWGVGGLLASIGWRRANLVVVAASCLGFAAFAEWTRLLPPLRGSAWTVRDTLVRAGAVVTGAVLLVSTVVALVPWGLDRLERGSLSPYIAARHVRAKKSGFLTLISGLSIFAVALGSFSLSGAISVMGGFSADLKRKILGNNAHIVIDTTSQSAWDDYEPTLERVRGIPGVVAATPVVQGEVMASSSSNLAGVVVHGIDPESIGNVIDLRKNVEAPVKVKDKLSYLADPELLRHLDPDEVIGVGAGGEEYTKGPDLPPLGDDIDPAVRAALEGPPLRPGLVVGRELAKTLHVYVGDDVTLVSPLGDLGPMGVMPKTRKYRIAAIFYSGMYEYDATHVYVTIDEAQSYFGTPNQITSIEVKVDDAENADRLTPLVAAAVDRPELRVRDWREINKNLFSALKLERIATFLILSIEIIVASFCIVCTLLLMMAEKAKEIAILKALGATDGTVMRTFMTEGVIIGGVGTLLGVSTGLALCTGLAWFGLRLDPDVYYIDRLPINVSGWDYGAVTIAALTICTLATIFPAWQAAQLRPVDGLRYE
ncbi:MAG TPA: ABC transporter permease [Polyangiaceae bacterium]|nr:ABC transporter permease [Polyangiaceae bacterium]